MNVGERVWPSRRRNVLAWGALMLAWVGLCRDVPAFNREDYEEPAGASFQFFFNPQDDIYGIAFGDGTWLVGTPLFGDFFLSLFHSRLEEATFGGVGMTLRVMPRWTLAPFIGGGGSYNLALGGGGPDTTVMTDEGMATTTSAGSESFWGAHAEAGIRLWLANRVGLIEVMGRYVWTSTDRDYWLTAVSTGTGF